MLQQALPARLADLGLAGSVDTRFQSVHERLVLGTLVGRILRQYDVVAPVDFDRSLLLVLWRILRVRIVEFLAIKALLIGQLRGALEGRLVLLRDGLVAGVEVVTHEALFAVHVLQAHTREHALECRRCGLLEGI